MYVHNIDFVVCMQTTKNLITTLRNPGFSFVGEPGFFLRVANTQIRTT